MTTQHGSFRDELQRLKKGVRMAWFVNFVLLTFTIEASIIVGTMSLGMNMAGLTAFLVATTVFSAIVAAIVVLVVNKRSSKILMGSVSDSNLPVTSGILYETFVEVCLAAGLGGEKQPELYIASGTGVINAYAIADGKGNSRVVLTEEILKVLNHDEIRAVLGHEVGHVVAGDSVDMTKIIALTSVVGMLSGIAMRFVGFGGRGRSNNNNSGPAQIIALVVLILSLIFLAVAPLLSKIAQNYMSRQREAQADALSVQFNRHGASHLAYALMKIDQQTAHLREEDLKHFKNKVGELALYAPPLGGKSMRTHPPTAERVRNLMRMGAQIDDQHPGGAA